MKVSNEELVKLVTTLSGIMAGMLEMNAKIAKAVVPLSTHLDANEKQNLMAYLEDVPIVVSQLRGACDQIKSQLDHKTDQDESRAESANSQGQDTLSGTKFDDLKTKAEAGDPDAQHRLGQLYFGEAEEESAANWYLKAAEQGFAPAQHQIGICYDGGRGVVRDKEKACNWFRKAADQGLPDAKHELGNLLLLRNSGEGVQYFQALAEQCDTYSQARLAWLFGDGDDVPKNDKEAFRWYLQSAQTGDVTNEYQWEVICSHELAEEIGPQLHGKCVFASFKQKQMITLDDEVFRIREHVPGYRP